MTLTQLLIVIILTIIPLAIVVYQGMTSDDKVKALLSIGAMVCIMLLGALLAATIIESNRLQEPQPQYEPVQEQLYRIKQ